jgi:hypothetical protein
MHPRLKGFQGISIMIIRDYGFTTLLIVIGSLSSPAQSPPTAEAQRQAMKKVDFLVGNWQGEGWMEFVPGQRKPFRGTETVQRKLDGLLLSIDGLHHAKVGERDEEAVVHAAFAILTFDPKEKRYRFQGFTSRGNHEDAEAKITDGQMVWSMKIPQFGDVRYTIKLDDKGRWFEIGEVTRDGTSWRKFFEMTLERAERK